MSSKVDKRSELVAEAAIEDPRARRRAERAATNREDILDAAEHVFAEKGPAGGSLRDIAQTSGFSTAAIYNYFENKQHLLQATLLRRANALYEALHAAAETATKPIDKLHAIVDAAIAFFETYPNFRRLLNYGPTTDDVLRSAIAELAVDNADLFTKILDLIANVMRQGQRAKQVRPGSPHALTRLYMVLVNEHVVLSSGHDRHDALTNDQFHDLIDGALRPT